MTAKPATPKSKTVKSSALPRRISPPALSTCPRQTVGSAEDFVVLSRRCRYTEAELDELVKAYLPAIARLVVLVAREHANKSSTWLEDTPGLHGAGDFGTSNGANH